MLVEGVKVALAMAQTQAFKHLGTRFWDRVPMPGKHRESTIALNYSLPLLISVKITTSVNQSYCSKSYFLLKCLAGLLSTH